MIVHQTLWDAIRDLSWLNYRSIVLVHKSLPALNGWDMKVYLEMLYDASSEWDSEVGDRGFHVIFLLDDKARVDFFLPGKFPHPQVKSKSALRQKAIYAVYSRRLFTIRSMECESF